ncbi:Mellein synthase [Paramyrothecium foliicola]|nr:Mellein synthase [Paramyrothecium foliicola]
MIFQEQFSYGDGLRSKRLQMGWIVSIAPDPSSSGADPQIPPDRWFTAGGSISPLSSETEIIMSRSSTLLSPVGSVQNDAWSPVSGSPKLTDSTEPSSEYGDVPSQYEDVAIVGVACRTPGGNNSPEQLWDFLLHKKDAAGEVPSWRWEPWLRRDARNAKELEKTISKGYFIEDLENFDAAFFGISPKEAEQMDPHQRLGLELSWEALENAGIDPKSLAGSDTAVFMGIDTDDYSRLLLEDLPNIEAWMGIGTAFHGVPNRISYHLDLMGPSTAVDAACASSLVAVHMGRQAILNRESDVAIVGGVHVLLAPALTRMLGKAGALSPDGVCRSFDDAANGYARGEGGAVIVLKRLSAAIRDGDNILAALKGSAIAQDGKTNGIMAPNAKAQELVGRQALSRAGIDPLSIGYVEAHATSTPLGDPTEIAAIQAIYGAGAGRPVDAPVLVGSIKPNIGHLEAAAGGIGLIKAVLSVNKGQLAPQARLQKLNTRVDWANSGLQIVRETTKWTSPEGTPRRAAVCSYGYGGTVSHAVVEEFAPRTPESSFGSTLVKPGMAILTLSAIQEKRLALHAAALSEWLQSDTGRGADLGSIARTLSQRRAHHDYRVAFVVDSHDAAASALQSYAAGKFDDIPSFSHGRVLGTSVPAVWVFSGHGAQWTGMGKELILDPVFVDTVTPLDAVVRREAGFSPLTALGTGDFEASERVQILTYVIQIGLSEVLKSKGSRPSAVIGHSVGEIAASVVAGCLTAVEGALIVTRRALLYARVRDQCPGGMALVNCSFDKTASALGKRKDLVAAIDSSPSSCVVSGNAGAVDEYVTSLKASGTKTFRVKTDVAFHSPMLDPLVPSLRQVLRDCLKPQSATIPVYSTSSIDARTSVPRDIEYWVTNMVKPVRLRSAVNAAAEDGYRVFVEVSSHPIVLHSVNETLVEAGIDDNDFATIPTMKRDMLASASIQHGITKLYTVGSLVNFDAYFGHERSWCRAVPTTPWVHRPYYKKVETGPMGGATTHDVEKHTLLGQRIAVGGTNIVVYSTKLDDKTKPFPGTHPLDGTEIIPAAVYINTFHHATGAAVLSNIKLRIPVSMSEETRKVQIILQGEDIIVASAPDTGADKDEDNSWVSHSSSQWGKLQDMDIEMSQKVMDIAAIQKRIGTLLPNSFAVDYLTKIGVAGIAFPWQVTEHYGNESEMMVRVDMDPSVDKLSWDEHSWAPLLDAATSVGSTIFFNDPRLRIVSQIDRVTLYTSDPLPKIGYLYVQEAADNISPASHVTVLNDQGTPLARFQSMRFSEVEGASGVSGSVESLVHRIAWIPPNFSEKPRDLTNVVVVANDVKQADNYVKQLTAHTKQVVSIRNVRELEQRKEITAALGRKGSAIFYLPGKVNSIQNVAAATEEYIWDTTCLVKHLESHSLASTCKLFVITDKVFAGQSTTGLAHGALYGLGRIIASEHPDLWGGLIDTETPDVFPVLAAKYVQGQDVVRIVDSLPRRPMLRPLSLDQRHQPGVEKTLLPKPEGTYVITGGLGDLGLETINFLVEKGARRIVAVSRNGLPSRRKWNALAAKDERFAAIAQRIADFEKLGASIHGVALDIAAPGASDRLLDAIDALGLPAVRGVIHAAGVLEDSLLLDTTRDSFARVLAPKISGAIALHEAFPPKTVDFFVLYSSIGQLVGTAGQASYGSGNAFLDALATYRRTQGDNAVAFQFTAWRSLGMATSTDFLTVELQSKGITDISREEAFRAWEHLNKFDVDGAVITRCLPVEEGSAVAVPLLEGVVIKKAKAVSAVPDQADNNSALASRPTDPQELEKWLNLKIRECIASVLLMGDIDDIDSRMPVADLGVDSVMTVALRQKLQTALNVKVPPTLTWNHPTVNHLVIWFKAKFLEE